MEVGSVIKIGLLVSIASIIAGCDYSIRPDGQYWDNPVGECPYRHSPSPECRDGRGFLLSIKIGESDE